MNGIECMKDCLCPRAQPEGIKNVHALNPIHEPHSYISLWWTILHTPLFCRFILLIFQKYTKNHHLYCHFPHLKVPVKSRKIGDLLGMYHSKQGCALCVYIRLGAWQQIFMTHFKFFSLTFSEILSYFSNKINRFKIINFKKVGLTFIKNNHTYFLKLYQISTNIDYWQGHERYLCMVTCGLLTNHRHGNHVLMYEQRFCTVSHQILPPNLPDLKKKTKKQKKKHLFHANQCFQSPKQEMLYAFYCKKDKTPFHIFFVHTCRCTPMYLSMNGSPRGYMQM